ncbi:DUF982 domain-containing protein [Chelativorans sp. YIM 93263]|uniref:DUF982 domain-containing protein n=1 Tax=Chelativorans sp. YIM 93263 TaxID=2906648 RepID=UPI002378E8A3|nr:DUF982 domain-containing protein [Chelativorans sp. YIM 93263]
MNNLVFSEPVSVVVGLSFPARIDSVAAAYGLLCEWPQHKRDAAYTIAANACRAAFRGEIEADTARKPFLAFARKHGILMPESDPVIAARHGPTVSQPTMA